MWTYWCSCYIWKFKSAKHLINAFSGKCFENNFGRAYCHIFLFYLTFCLTLIFIIFISILQSLISISIYYYFLSLDSLVSTFISYLAFYLTCLLPYDLTYWPWVYVLSYSSFLFFVFLFYCKKKCSAAKDSIRHFTWFSHL